MLLGWGQSQVASVWNESPLWGPWELWVCSASILVLDFSQNVTIHIPWMATRLSFSPLPPEDNTPQFSVFIFSCKFFKKYIKLIKTYKIISFFLLADISEWGVYGHSSCCVPVALIFVLMCTFFYMHAFFFSPLGFIFQ